MLRREGLGWTPYKWDDLVNEDDEDDTAGDDRIPADMQHTEANIRRQVSVGSGGRGYVLSYLSRDLPHQCHFLCAASILKLYWPMTNPN